uniref:Uncharacterized protein n=1 Tax=Arundo donax TaxID=35708 RepID=A0A0A8ZA26_ARUDO
MVIGIASRRQVGVLPRGASQRRLTLKRGNFLVGVLG